MASPEKRRVQFSQTPLGSETPQPQSLARRKRAACCRGGDHEGGFSQIPLFVLCPPLTIFYAKKPKHFFQQLLRHLGARWGSSKLLIVAHATAPGWDMFLTTKSLGPFAPRCSPGLLGSGSLQSPKACWRQSREHDWISHPSLLSPPCPNPALLRPKVTGPKQLELPEQVGPGEAETVEVGVTQIFMKTHHVWGRALTWE